jgi:hypothetical protein
MITTWPFAWCVFVLICGAAKCYLDTFDQS